jgi:hypothetical protein
MGLELADRIEIWTLAGRDIESVRYGCVEEI